METFVGSLGNSSEPSAYSSVSGSSAFFFLSELLIRHFHLNLLCDFRPAKTNRYFSEPFKVELLCSFIFCPSSKMLDSPIRIFRCPICIEHDIKAPLQDLSLLIEHLAKHFREHLYFFLAFRVLLMFFQSSTSSNAGIAMNDLPHHFLRIFTSKKADASGTVANQTLMTSRSASRRFVNLQQCEVFIFR